MNLSIYMGNRTRPSINCTSIIKVFQNFTSREAITRLSLKGKIIQRQSFRLVSTSASKKRTKQAIHLLLKVQIKKNLLVMCILKEKNTSLIRLQNTLLD